MIRHHILKFFAVLITTIVMEINNKAIGITLILLATILPTIAIFSIPFLYPHILTFFIAGYLFSAWLDIIERLTRIEIITINLDGEE